MRHHGFILLIVLLVIVSFGGTGCKDSLEPGALVLTAEDSLFAGILSELHLQDSELYAGALEFNRESNLESNLPLLDTAHRDSILASHEMDEDSFMRLVEAYLEDPDRLLSIYNLALDQASSR